MQIKILDRLSELVKELWELDKQVDEYLENYESDIASCYYEDKMSLTFELEFLTNQYALGNYYINVVEDDITPIIDLGIDSEDIPF